MNPLVKRTYFVIEIKQHKLGTLVPGLAEVKGRHWRSRKLWNLSQQAAKREEIWVDFDRYSRHYNKLQDVKWFDLKY